MMEDMTEMMFSMLNPEALMDMMGMVCDFLSPEALAGYFWWLSQPGVLAEVLSSVLGMAREIITFPC
jgi:glucose-6-phosphate dehydrogenase assembly protein OpcA